MNTTKLKRELLASQWTQRIADFKSSGLPLKEWLALNNLSKDQYYYWKRKLSDEVLDAVTTTTFVELPQIISNQPVIIEEASMPKTTMDRSTQTPDAILNINGIEIKLFNSAATALLKNVIEVARHA